MNFVIFSQFHVKPTMQQEHPQQQQPQQPEQPQQIPQQPESQPSTHYSIPHGIHIQGWNITTSNKQPILTSWELDEYTFSIC